MRQTMGANGLGARIKSFLANYSKVAIGIDHKPSLISLHCLSPINNNLGYRESGEGGINYGHHKMRYESDFLKLFVPNDLREERMERRTLFCGGDTKEEDFVKTYILRKSLVTLDIGRCIFFREGGMVVAAE